jgi:hypothetical protein
MLLAEILGIGILVQAAFAGGFLGGHHIWLNWHQRIGDLLVVFPLASLLVALALRRRQTERSSMLGNRLALVLLVIGVEATGHAGGSLLAVHIPAAVATMALVVHQGVTAAEGRRASNEQNYARGSREERVRTDSGAYDDIEDRWRCFAWLSGPEAAGSYGPASSEVMPPIRTAVPS